MNPNSIALLCALFNVIAELENESLHIRAQPTTYQP